MRDPLSWSIPLFRAFGIQVRLHVLFIVITLGLILNAYLKSVHKEQLYEYVLIWVVMLFGIVLLHEFGHCFAARREGGDATEILIWPLGGLAMCDVPHSPRAHFVTAAGGPFVNVIICVVCALALMPFKLLPPLNPFNFEHIIRPQLHNWSDGHTYYNAGAPLFVDPKTGNVINLRDIDSYFFYDGKVFGKPEGSAQAFEMEPYEIPGRTADRYNTFVLWTARLFWLSWWLFLFNLLPAFPLDGGRLLQSLVWGRTADYRRGTMVAVYAGFVVALAFIVLSFWFIHPMLLLMALFIYYSCRQQYIALEMAENESVFGYDFSQGYTSLEKDEPPAPRAKQPGPLKRWLQARRERKAQATAHQRAADEARMDELLDKIHREGKEALSDEERRFMDRVSARYRNRS